MAMASPQIVYPDTSRTQSILQLVAMLQQALGGMGQSFQQAKRTGLMEKELGLREAGMEAGAEKERALEALRQITAGAPGGPSKDSAAIREAMLKTGAPLSKVATAQRLAGVERPSDAEVAADKARKKKETHDFAAGWVLERISSPEFTLEQGQEALDLAISKVPGTLSATEVERFQGMLEERAGDEAAPQFAEWRQALADGTMSWDQFTLNVAGLTGHSSLPVRRMAHAAFKEGMGQRIKAAEAAGDMAEMASNMKAVFQLGMSENYDEPQKVRTFNTMLKGGLRRSFITPTSEAEKDWAKAWGGKAVPVTTESFEAYLLAKADEMRVSGRPRSDAIHVTNLQLMALSKSNLPSLEGKMKEIRNLFATSSFTIEGELPSGPAINSTRAWATKIVNKVYGGR